MITAGTKGLLASFIFLIASTALLAQDETMRIFKNDVSEYRNDTLWTFGNQPTLMLIPFDPIMYKSQIDRKIAQNDGTNYEQIVGNWQRALDNMLFIETDAHFSVIRLLADDEGRQQDLTSFNRASALDYRELPAKEETSDKKLKLPKLKSKEEEKPSAQPARIENGQIVSEVNQAPRFMARNVVDSAIFDYLYGKYGSVLYVCINQFDLGPMAGLDYRAYESDEYQQQITVHYSIYTHKHELHSGVAIAHFSSTVESQKDIIIENFPTIAKQIVEHLPTLISGDVNEVNAE